MEHGELNGRIFHSALWDHLSRDAGLGFGVNIPQSKQLFKSQRTERDSERGAGETGGVRDERRPNTTKGEQDPSLPTDREGFRVRGESVIVGRRDFITV